MHVLMLPSTYPRFYKPLSGIFYRDQAIALRSGGIDVGVLDASPRTLRTLRRGRLGAFRFQARSSVEDGLSMVTAYDWSVPYATRLTARQFLWRANNLYGRYIRRFGRPDVIHAHELLWGGVAAAAISKRTGVPYVVTEHSGEYALAPLPAYRRRSLASTMTRAAAMIVVSADLGRRLKRFGAPSALTVVPNVVDTDFFLPPATAPADECFVFVSIATQVMDKGIDTLVRAFALAFRDAPGVRMEIGGAGPDRPVFEALARSLGVDRQITWLGALSREQVLAVLRRAHAFVLPSRYETFGVVYVEAMAVGLPVIATKCGGPEDFVDSESGYLVDVASVDQTAAAMVALHRDRSRWRRQASAIRQSAVDRFGRRAVVRQLTAIYRSVVARAATAAELQP